GPVLVGIDDVQWLDSASEAVVAFASRRLRSAPVRLLLARRPDDHDSAPLGLGRVLPDDRLQHLDVGPLSVGAVHRLLQDRLEIVFPRPILHRLHEASGGNPFFALELARLLGRRGARLAPGERLPVPDTLHELVQDRLARLPDKTQEALTVAAALSQPTVDLVAAATGDNRALDDAVKAEIVELDGDRIRFSHPLLASAAYGSPHERRALHRQLAALVEDADERVRHLATGATRPDESVARALDEAAARAVARGATGMGAELLEQAAELTPVDDPDERLRRMLAAGEHHVYAGDRARAHALYESVVDAAAPGRLHADALVRLGSLHKFGADQSLAADLYRAAIEEAEAEPTILFEAHIGLSNMTVRMLDDLDAGTRHARAAVEAAERRQDPARVAEALVVLAWMETMIGRPRAIDRAKRAVSLPHGEVASDMLSCLLVFGDELDGARQLLERWRTIVLEHGEESSLPILLRFWSYAEWLAGNWVEAARLAEEGYEVALTTGQRSHEAVLLGTKALLAASVGNVEQARRDAEAGIGLVEATAYWYGELVCLPALGLLELSLGNAEAAHALLEPLAARAEAAGLREPGHLRFLADEIEALVALGRLDDAEVLLQRLEGPSRALDRASGLALAARCRALIAGARKDLVGALEGLEEALTQHDRVEIPFDRARTLLVLGQVRRRSKQKRAAREALDAAAATFDELGAVLWAKRARAEDARVSGRKPSDGPLTPSELRVAELVADGHSNKDVAAALFLTPQTVESHLKHIYAKLGIRSRTQLARRLVKSRD
ncbi:MAG TPA: LuxR C-terminal-related transcriptional regulator, partial [Gaiellaceae bacterium]|nr:LuxR C-terminal-related transcriptional regulator [Gaiellaceae bacterium]